MAILSPTYGEYAHCFAAAGFRVDALGSLDDLRAEHGTLVVVNPNNPDGRRLSRAHLVALHGRMLAQQGHLHVDEAFGDCQPELSVADLAGRSAGLTVSRSFGKVFGLAGVRLGFVFALPDCLRAVEASLGPWAVSGPALHLARHLMTGDRLSLHEAIDQRRRGLQRVLDSAGLHLVGGTELFALVAHPDAARLFDHLANAHILVRKFDYAPDWLRIGLTPNQQEDERLERRLASFEP